jgi:hypothetical protein
MDTSLPLGSVTLPTMLVIVSTMIFLALERVFPGRTFAPLQRLVHPRDSG